VNREGGERVGFAWVSLLTDYGLEDGFVAACHGIVAAIAPQARVIDVTHLVPPGDIARGAAVLAQTVPHLPAAVHVAVVDPGVGTPRRGLAIAAGDSVLVGPDNGLLPPAADALGGIRTAHALTEATLWRRPVSATFHGRDVFCPVAAHLANGTPLDAVGPRIDPATLVRLPAPIARIDVDGVEGAVVTVDRFGNVQLGVGAPPQWRAGQTLVVEAGEAHEMATYVETFAAVPPGELAVFVDSAGLLAIAVNAGSAADRLQVSPGIAVSVRQRRA
jgi:S-adenosylmethionine hydrolase